MSLIDLTGQRFGRLTVTTRSPGGVRHAEWKVTCDCGATKTVRGDHLRGGRVRSCGCLNAELSTQRRLVVIQSGTRFGRLTVLSLATSKGQARWLCRCDCGTERVVTGRDLRRGDTSSCGCYARESTSLRSRKAAPGYYAAHLRVAAARGRAKDHECVDCGEPACDWSYDHKDADEFVASAGIAKDLAYSTSPDHYQPRCRPCHKAFDGARGGVFL